MSVASTPASKAPPPRPEARKRSLNWSEILFRVAIVAMIVCSLALAWWSLTWRLFPLQKQSRQLASTVARLSDAVDTLERKWPRAEVARTRDDYQVARSQLFADEASLAAWLASWQQKAAELGLAVKVDFGKSRDLSSGDAQLDVALAPVSVEVRPFGESSESSYRRLLQLGRQLASEGRRADLSELTVSSGVGSISSARLVFDLWAGEEREEAEKSQQGKAK